MTTSKINPHFAGRDDAQAFLSAYGKAELRKKLDWVNVQMMPYCTHEAWITDYWTAFRNEAAALLAIKSVRAPR